MLSFILNWLLLRKKTMSEPLEPRNPFYIALLLVSLLFVMTALGIGVVPVLEEKARQAGVPPPPSEFRDAMREDGWRWILYELAALFVLGIASMGLDRLRRLKKDRAAATIPPVKSDPGEGAT
jgi:hypothetical protein